jgi:hypothetical protein
MPPPASDRARLRPVRNPLTESPMSVAAGRQGDGAARRPGSQGKSTGLCDVCGDALDGPAAVLFHSVAPSYSPISLTVYLAEVVQTEYYQYEESRVHQQEQDRGSREGVRALHIRRQVRLWTVTRIFNPAPDAAPRTPATSESVTVEP